MCVSMAVLKVLLISLSPMRGEEQVSGGCEAWVVGRDWGDKLRSHALSVDATEL